MKPKYRRRVMGEHSKPEDLDQCCRCRRILQKDETLWKPTKDGSKSMTCPSCGGQTFYRVTLEPKKGQ